MKSILNLLFSLISFTLLGQQPTSTNNADIPANPNYFDFVNFYLAENPNDTTEGNFTAQIKKQNRIWGERLFPSGNAQLAGAAITNYAKNFNLNGSQNCVVGNWFPIGPTGYPIGSSGLRGNGQMHEVKFSPNYLNDGVVYSCSNWGGLWRSTNGGGWQLVNTDHQLAFTSVSDIAIDPFDTNILYITTGEAETTIGHHAQNPNGTPSTFTPLFTAGVYRSFDGGVTWESINGANEEYLCYFDLGGTIRKIKMHPNNNQQLFIATSLGVFRIDNAQSNEPTWTYLTEEIDDLELKGLEFNPDNPQNLYASGTDIYQSNDGGDIWTSMTGAGTGLDLDNLPNDFGVFRINIAVTPANSDNLYAYITGRNNINNHAYIYLYNGNTWQEIYSLTETSNANSFITPQRTAITVAPNNANEIYFGTSVLWGTNDHTVMDNIRPLMNYTGDIAHPDIHGLAFEPNSNNLFVATDGGIHIKDRAQQNNNDASWTQLSDGLQVATSYAFDDTEDKVDRIIIGNQDTGTNVYKGNSWEVVQLADGYNGKIDDKTGLAFASRNGSSAFRIFSYDFDRDRIMNEFGASTRPTDPSTNQPLLVRGTYDMVNHPQTERMYFTMAELQERQFHRQNQSGDTAEDMWYLRSDIGKFGGEQFRRQHLTELTINEANPDWMLLAQSGEIADLPANQKSEFVEPRLFRTTIGGCEGEAGYLADMCWHDITENMIASGVINTSYQALHPDNPSSIIPIITGLTYDPENHNKAYVCFTGYEPTAKVWMTNDGGETWENLDPNLSLFNLPVNEIVYQKGTNDMLYIGTDAGVYYKDASMSDWVKYCDFPNVRVMDLKINYCMGKIRAATFGRSIWEGDLQESDGTIGTTALRIEENTTWDFSRGLDKNLLVTTGNTLTIETPTGANELVRFSMPKDGKIIVEPGAKLEISNAILTNNCGQTWQGIQLEGNENIPHTEANQGVLVLNNARVEHADNAIMANIAGSYGGGGIIQATNTVFANNKRTVEFFPHPERNKSFFNGCSFQLDNDYRFDSFLAHITMFGMEGVSFYNCDFSITHPDFKYQDDGIFVENAHFEVSLGSWFSGFRNGIRAENGSRAFSVIEATFTDNTNGISALNVLNIEIANITCNDNQIGVELNNSQATIECSDFYNNAQYGVFYGDVFASFTSSAPATIAELCWWGDASGASHFSNAGGTGDEVTNNIDFTPWANTLTGSCKESPSLPIELLSFTAWLQKDQSIKLQWEVGAEIAISNYQIERSIDGVVWKGIGKIPATQQHIYTFTDRKVPFSKIRGVVYYRLSTIGETGQLEAKSALVSVPIPKHLAIDIWYNTAQHQLSLTLDPTVLESNLTADIYSIDGKLLQRYQTTDFVQDANALYLPLQQLPTGFYVVHFNIGQEVISQKFSVVR